MNPNHLGIFRFLEAIPEESIADEPMSTWLLAPPWPSGAL